MPERRSKKLSGSDQVSEIFYSELCFPPSWRQGCILDIRNAAIKIEDDAFRGATFQNFQIKPVGLNYSAARKKQTTGKDFLISNL